MRTSRKSIILILITTFIVAFAQLLLKKGVMVISISNLLTIFNISLVAGCALYAVSAIIMIYSLKKGELSVIYPIIALTFVWVALLSRLILNESLGTLKLVGITTIVLGVALLGLRK